PCMSSALVLPTRVLLALSPTYTAMAGSLLDHGDVGRRDAGTGLHSGDELRAACAVAVRVVIQLPGAAVEDEAIVRVVGSRAREEASISGGKTARRPGRGER